jgi:hypothetical protein
MIVVFATNMDPSDLADDAFLRRIQNKIYMGPVSPSVFDEIFDRLVAEKNISCEPDSAAFLRQLCQKLGAKNLQACVPSDIIDIVDSINLFEGSAPELSKENLKRAAKLYFTKPQTVEEE